jgi:RES domain-containing protein
MSTEEDWNGPAPALVDVEWTEAVRIIPSRFPPVNVFEGIYDTPDEMETAFAIEALTNKRLRQEVGELRLVTPEDRVWGPGASVVMACFTHIGRPSRFSDGGFGVYYAAESLATAIAETRHHRERFLAATDEEDLEITMRAYVGRVQRPLLDLRGGRFEALLDPNDYRRPQQAGGTWREVGHWGVVYPSVRRPGGECIAAFRPPAVTLPVPSQHLRYVWSQREGRITHVFGVEPVG